MSGTIMRDEIGQQPEAVERTLEALREPTRELAASIERRGVSSVVLVARGTSDHAALYARYLLEARCGLLSALAAPSLYTAYRAPVDLSRALVIGVSQSGQVPEIVDSLEYARARGALTAALTNDAGSALAGAADHLLATSAGPELAVVATKTFTTQLAAIALLAAALGADAVGRSLPRVPEAMAETIEQGWAAERAANALLDRDGALCVARGFSYCIALEAALKLKEATGLWAEGFSSADLRHGPRAAARRLPALVFHAGGALAADVEAVESELAEAGSVTIPIGPGRQVPTAGDLPEEVMPLVLAIPAQILTERLARMRGWNPDQPPGLTKVTPTA